LILLAAAALWFALRHASLFGFVRN